MLSASPCTEVDGCAAIRGSGTYRCEEAYLESSDMGDMGFCEVGETTGTVLLWVA